MSTLLKTFAVASAVAAVSLAGCVKEDGKSKSASTQPVVEIRNKPVVQPAVGLQQRTGDEIVVAGHFYRIGTPVVTWMDPGGYDAYRVERRFTSYAESSWQATTRAIAAGKSDISEDSPARYSLRYAPRGRAATGAATQTASTQAVAGKYTPEELEQVRGGGWTLPMLQKIVDQFVLHYDVCGTSRQCFKVLHDGRGLSVHFMLDIDGTIYQTLDLKEATWHATKANGRSIGIEIANMGSYSVNDSGAFLAEWYKKDAQGKTYITIPERFGGAKAIRTQGVTLRPMRNEPVIGEIRGSRQRMYDLTPQQYDALIKLTAALGDVFPQITLDYPRGTDGKLLTRTLTADEWEQYKGVLGHYHVQNNKSDPGPALQWDYVIDNARRLLADRKPAMAAK